MSKIEWTMQTWNPITGCDKVSDGCKNCYAIKHAYRLMHMPHSKEKYAGTVEKTAGGKLNWTGKINVDEGSLMKPFGIKKATMFFVNSMSDLFHQDVPFDFVDKVFAVMAATPHHTYQILTKRPNNMLQYFNRIRTGGTKWLNTAVDYNDVGNVTMYKACHTAFNIIDINNNKPLPNVWLGVSVENQKAADERIPLLQKVPAAVRFLSCEPLLGPVDIMKAAGTYLSPSRFSWNINREIHWVIAGGESGHDARPSHPDWFRQLRDQCTGAGVPFFFKQWGEWYPAECSYSAITGYGKKGYLYKFYTDDPVLKGKKIYSDALEHLPDPGGSKSMFKLGKHITGRLLDGVTHDEMPKR